MIIILVLILLFLPMKISIKYKNKTEDKLVVKVTLVNDLINFHVHSNNEDKKKEKNSKKNWQKTDLLEYVFLEKENILLYLKKTKVLKFKWISVIGCNDAALTAIMTGVLWTLKYNAIGFLFRENPVEELFINVIPEFNNYEIKTEIICIFETKLVNIINIGLRFLIYKKGGDIFVRAPN